MASISRLKAKVTPGSLEVKFTWNISGRLSSGDYCKLWIRETSESSYGSVIIKSPDDEGYDYTFSRTGTFEAHIVLYNSNGVEIDRDPTTGDIDEFEITDEVPAQNPEITNYDASIYNLMNRQVFCKVKVSNPDKLFYDVDIYANDRNSTRGGTYLGLFSSGSDNMSHTGTFELYENKIYYIYFILRVGSEVIETTSTIKLDFSLPEPTVTIDTISQNPGVNTANVYWSTTNLNSVDNAKFTIQARISSESTWYNKATNLSSNTTSYTISFDRNGTYYVRIKLTGDNIDTTYSNEKSIYIYIQVPASWSWSYNASNAFNNKGSIKNLTRTEWNNFIDRVNTAISYYNFYNPNDKKNLISSTSKMQDDKILYASSFRDVINKLNQLRSVNINTNNIQTGEIIYGNYFNYLSQALNNYIDSI